MTQTPPAPVGGFDDLLAARLLHQRIVVVGAEVDDALANRVCAELLLLSAEDRHTDISLYINSPGGSVTAGLAISDTVRLVPNDVSTLGMGLAASTAQFLLSAGTKGKRYVLPHTRVVMRQPAGDVAGRASDVAVQAEDIEHSTRLVHTILADATGQPLARIAEDSDRGRWFTAREALDYGLVDRIVDNLDDVRPAAMSRKVGL